MAISDWPESERPREKLVARGAGALSDGELLAIVLRTGSRGQSALSLARALLAAEEAALCQQPGVGSVTWALLQACAEISRRSLLQGLEAGGALDNPRVAERYLQFDNRHRVLAFEPLFRGTLDCASVYPREVVKRALAANAAAVILAHNHPSGCAEPSQADRQITGTLREALALVGVRVLDHLVVGRGESASLAERGWL